jgi:hypothetical protein
MLWSIYLGGNVLFKNVRVLIADGEPDKSGDQLYIKGCRFSRNVPIYNAKGRGLENLVGTAKLRKKKDSIYADILLVEESMQINRAGLRVLAPFLYPAISGKILRRQGNSKIMEFTIDGLIVSPSHNADWRINPIRKHKP